LVANSKTPLLHTQTVQQLPEHSPQAEQFVAPQARPQAVIGTVLGVFQAKVMALANIAVLATVLSQPLVADTA
jgi:hypothetical protein